MHLDEPHARDPQQHVHRRVETLHVSDLQDPPRRRGQRDHLVGLGQALGDRLLDQHVLACVEGGAGHPQVIHGGDGDADGVDLGQQVAKMGEGARAVAGRRFAGPGFVDVEHPHETRFGQRGAHPGVMAADATHPDHAQADAAHAPRSVAAPDS